MKAPHWQHHGDNEAGALASGLTACDGATITGELGHLHIVLGPRILRLRAGEPFPTHWLLPLEDLEMARQAADLPGEILWLSPLPPECLAGPLVGEFRGAWWEGLTVCVNLTGQVEAYEFLSSDAAVGSRSVLADIVARRWAGCPPGLLRDELARARDLRRPLAAPAAVIQTYQPNPQFALA
jgi:hypothetical protein